MANADFDLDIPSDLFNPSGKNKGVPFVKLKLDVLVPYKQEIFKTYTGQKLADRVESIKALGVLVPIIVRPINDGKFEILSGHNRTNAAKLAGLKTIDAIIKEGLTEEEALLIVTESNIHQRSIADMAHSERAIALATHYDAIKQQGRRNDLVQEVEMLLKSSDDGDSETLSLLGKKSTSMDKMSDDYGLSKNVIARYIRVNTLIKPLKVRLDNDDFGIYAAYALTFLNENEQNIVHDVLDNPKNLLDTQKAEFLRQASKKNPLTSEIVIQILSGKKVRKEPKENKQPYPTSFKVRPEVVLKHFAPGTEKQEIEDTIEEALDFYFGARNKPHEPTDKLE